MKKFWTKEEDEELIRQRSYLSYDDIQVPGRTKIAIKARISHLVSIGLIPRRQLIVNRWTEEEETLMVSLLESGCSTAEVAEALGRTCEAVKTRRKRFASGRATSWTNEDVSLLDSDKSYKEMAQELGKTERAVGAKLQKLRILKTKYSDKYSKEDLLNLVRKYKRKQILNYCREEGEPSAGVIERMFGSWSSALKAAGLPPNLGEFDETKDTILYLVDFGDFKKIGITQRSVELRLKGFPTYVLLDTVVFNNPIAAFETEQEILSKVERVYGDIPNGNTECFVSAANSLCDLI